MQPLHFAKFKEETLYLHAIAIEQPIMQKWYTRRLLAKFNRINSC